MTVTERVPDLAEEIVGWRAWRLIGTERLPLLASVSAASFIWHPGRWTVATCQGEDHCTRFPPGTEGFDGGVPGECCTCGMYAAASRTQLVSLGYNRGSEANPVLIGEAALVGKVIPGTQGWRAEKGRIRKLYVPFSDWRFVEPLQALYSVPVELDNTFKAESAFARPGRR